MGVHTNVGGGIFINRDLDSDYGMRNKKSRDKTQNKGRGTFLFCFALNFLKHTRSKVIQSKNITINSEI